jgi:ubiquinone/menaquinone biosynthesis C-methylase UbiE
LENKKNSNCLNKPRYTSFWLHKFENIFEKINLKRGNVFLDLGCGTGDYSISASKIVGKTGRVIAIDKQDKLIFELNDKIRMIGYEMIETHLSDITKPFPVKDNSVDVCLISTVLHSFFQNFVDKSVFFNEIKRVLKDCGKLVIIECKKEEMHIGPPLNNRISENELQNICENNGLKKIDLKFFDYTYMMILKKII